MAAHTGGQPAADPEAAEPAADPEAAEPAADAEAAELSAAAVAASTRAVDEYAAGTDATIAVAVRDTAQGQESVGAAGAQQIYSASVSKLYTVVSVLHRADTGEVTLTDDDRADIDAALTSSDDGAMNALWVKFGGPESIRDTIALAGLTDSAPPQDPSQWGETLISARDVVAVYDFVLTGLSPAGRDLVLDALGAATREGADGFDQAFGLLDPAQVGGADAKQGWMYYGSRLYLHSAGLVGTGDRFVVAVLTVGPTSAGADAGRSVVDGAVAAALAPLDAA
ncbi:serine hydrolase [Pseudonocardia sp.]|uniref:serine hydrolase n=1 Tax=Pseudonocardia sp. TaxID=60912 RepID=UPI003D10771B